MHRNYDYLGTGRDMKLRLLVGVSDEELLKKSPKNVQCMHDLHSKILFPYLEFFYLYYFRIKRCKVTEFANPTIFG